MNTKHSVQHQSKTLRRQSKAKAAAAACLKSCRSMLLRLQGIKDSVLREFESPRKEQEQMVRFALNEAEALAWQTPYPYLLFPVLAREKAESARQWVERQRRVRDATMAFAA